MATMSSSSAKLGFRALTLEEDEQEQQEAAEHQCHLVVAFLLWKMCTVWPVLIGLGIKISILQEMKVRTEALPMLREFEPAPHICRYSIAVYEEDDLRNPIWAPPG
ncbi:hypothetical protein U1Q18_008313 [Sarracenia purpurea var. burkii]